MATLYRTSTVLKIKRSGAFAQDDNLRPYLRRSGLWQPARGVLLRRSGLWLWRASRPDFSISGGGAANAAGGNNSGRTSVQVFSNRAGDWSGVGHKEWEFLSGDSSIFPDNANADNPIFSKDFAGVPNGSTSAGVSAQWRCRFFDDNTGAFSYADVTIGPLSWTNTIPAYTPVQATTPANNISASVDSGFGDSAYVQAPAQVDGNYGTGSYTYFWEQIAGPDSLSFSSTTAHIPYVGHLFEHLIVGENYYANGTVRGHVSDGTSADFVDITVTLAAFRSNGT